MLMPLRTMPKRLMPMRLGRSVLILPPHAIFCIQYYAKKFKLKQNPSPLKYFMLTTGKTIPVG
eukprot:1634210-Amphidinium_carterae.1